MTVTSQEEGLDSACWLCPCCMEFACVDSAFLPQSKEMHFRLTGDSELAKAVNVCVNDRLSLVTCPGSSPPVAS